MSLFQRRNVEEYTDSLAKYLPNDPLFSSKYIQNSNLRKLLIGIATELYRAGNLIKLYNEEILPDQTERFIGELETVVGIPDSCFKGDGDIDERRRDVLIKMASLGIQTVDDFVYIAGLFGIDVEIVPAVDTIEFPVTFPIPMFDTELEARNTFIVRYTVEGAATFPLTFPITFGTKELGIIECLFNKLKPATGAVIFEQI